ncbi:unnamed protein product, partial [Musa banksii]
KDESTYEWGRRASPAHAVPHAFPRIPLLPRPPPRPEPSPLALYLASLCLRECVVATR